MMIIFIMKFLSWCFSHKSRRKQRHKARKAVRTAEINNHPQVWLCSLWGNTERMWLWKTSWTLHVLNRPPSRLLGSIQLSQTLANHKKVNKKHPWKQISALTSDSVRNVCISASALSFLKPTVSQAVRGGEVEAFGMTGCLDVNLWGNSFSLQSCTF